jgi:hypothetical protein
MAAPVLELAEHVFDFVALAIEIAACGIGSLRFILDGMQASMPRSIKAARSQSAS